MSKENLNSSSDALSIRQAVAEGNIGRSRLYLDLRSGRLKAKKVGRRTIILRPDWDAYLAALPNYQPQSSADPISVNVDAGQEPPERNPAGNGARGRRRSRGGDR